MHSVASLKDEAKEEAGVSGSGRAFIEVSSDKSIVYKVIQGSTGDMVGMYISVLLCSISKTEVSFINPLKSASMYCNWKSSFT